MSSIDDLRFTIDDLTKKARSVVQSSIVNLKSSIVKAWMIKLRITNLDELKELLSAEEYEEYIQEQSGG